MRYYEVDFKITTGTSGADIQDVRDLIAAFAGEAGFETFEETDNGIKGYIQTSMYDEEALKQAIDNIPMEGTDITYNVKEAEYKDWNEQWENEGFMPVTIADKCVIHDGRHLPEGNFDISIEIDARMAFGTGTHETTRMMVATLLAEDLTGKSVLDCGCGTGILGIAALKGGAAKTVGYDIDEWSVDNARHNAVINNVDDKFKSILGDASVLDDTNMKFDIVVANINRNILLNDMERFRSVMKDDGELIMSGFYKEDTDALKTKGKSISLTPKQEKNDGDWACISFISDNKR